MGYTAAGKTGTAQISDRATHHYTHLYNASFMGFAPVTNPAIVMVVTANGARARQVTVGRSPRPCFEKWRLRRCA